MAEEILIPARIWPHRVTNASGLYTHVSFASNLHMPEGWRLPTSAAVDYNAALSTPIPPGLHATPAGKLRLHWLTPSSDTASATRLFCKLKSLAAGAGAFGWVTWDEELQADQTSAGANLLNQMDFTISTTNLSVGRFIALLLRRDKPGTPADALNDTIYVLGATLIADAA